MTVKTTPNNWAKNWEFADISSAKPAPEKVFNARKDIPITDKNPTLTFDYHLIEYKWDDSWVEDTISRMIKVLNYEVEAISNPCCKDCAYIREAQKYDASLIGECYE